MRSKAEGLDLPGSDDDYMYDINDKAKGTVIQSTHDPHDASSQNTFYLLVCTNDVPPCFLLYLVIITLAGICNYWVHQ